MRLVSWSCAGVALAIFGVVLVSNVFGVRVSASLQLVLSSLLVAVLAIALGPQWTTLQHYFNQLATTQDPQALLQQLTEAQQAHGFDISSFALGLLQKILQPLLGIAFVVLYLDSKIHSER